MAKVNAHVWHNLNGEIVAVGRPKGKAACLPLAEHGQSVIQVEVDQDTIKDLHRTHIVDSTQKCLTKHPLAKGVHKAH